ncbi:MAG: 5'-nucleotidase C-terminal domain-containing protein [Thermovirgaceae bacterium]|nr:5'-nucleotidase C-terminal domain-containing protein [Thermovirgaceae bacterium]
MKILRLVAIRKTLLSLIALLFFAFPLDAAQLTILHVNDTHGHIWTESGKGGFDALALLVEEVRREVTSKGGDVIFLHGGDVNTGIPESDLQQGLCDLSILRKMGCDAMVLGNHEFDNPLALLRFQETFAGFPFICANFVDSLGKRPFFTHVLIESGDLKVAVLGLTTESTGQSEPLYLEGGRFLDVIETARDMVPRLRENADIVIALGHLGWDNVVPGSTGSGDLAGASIEGLDVIIDGHSHTLFDNAALIGSTLVAQAGAFGKYLGRFDLEIEDGRITDWKWKAIPIDPAGGEDPEITNRLDYYEWVGSRKIDQVIGSSKTPLDGDRVRVRSGETNLTRLVADAIREVGGADISIVNGGGIRDSIPAGEIRMRDVLAVLPFRNDLVCIDLTGKEVAGLLHGVSLIKPGLGAFPHVSGVRVRFIDGGAEISIDGALLDPEKNYRLATSSYLASGADGYDVMLPFKGRAVDIGFTDTDALARYIEKHTPIDEKAEAE